MDVKRQYAIDLEVRKLRSRRRDVVEKLYAKYKLTISPQQWNHLPSVYNICRLGPFVPLIEADANSSVVEADFHFCMAALPLLIAEAYQDTKSRLRQSVLEAKHPTHDGIEGTEFFQELELATMVFRCGTCREFVVGFHSGVNVHNCSPQIGLAWGNPEEALPLHDEFPHPFEFSTKGASVAAQVLEGIDLDPTSVPTSQLMQNHYAFRCLECLQDSEVESKDAYSWVAMVSSSLVIDLLSINVDI